MDGRDAGGIRALLDLIEEHRGALEYDWRSRFGLALAVVGTDAMCWGEAYRLTLVLLNDPTSQLCAAAGRWRTPWSRDSEMLALLVEIGLRSNAKHPGQVRPLPRPWTTPDVATTARPALPQAVVRAVLLRARQGRIRFGTPTTV